MNVFADISFIKKVLSGDTVIDITYDQGEGRLDRDPVLQPDQQDKTDVRHPNFFGGDGMSSEPSNKDPIEELK